MVDGVSGGGDGPVTRGTVFDAVVGTVPNAPTSTGGGVVRGVVGLGSGSMRIAGTGVAGEVVEGAARVEEVVTTDADVVEVVATDVEVDDVSACFDPPEHPTNSAPNRTIHRARIRKNIRDLTDAGHLEFGVVPPAVAPAVPRAVPPVAPLGFAGRAHFGEALKLGERVLSSSARMGSWDWQRASAASYSC